MNNEDKLQSKAAQEYKAAGVDLEAGYEVQRRIKDDVAKTQRPGTFSGIGGFGGMFDLSALKAYQEPVLVSGTDGVGTKLFLAFEMNKHDTIGQDAVAMCVNDVLVQGAEPLFFLDYLALSKAEPALVAEIVSGVAGACVESGCALVGGETAEMNDLYAPGHYDIAGFAVGIAEKSQLITGENLLAGDVLLGLNSTGVHSNGFSLLRKVYFKDNNYNVDSKFPELDRSLGKELLEPTRLYVKPVLSLLKEIRPHALCHVTGGGFYENLPRMSEKNFRYTIDKNSWKIPAIFELTAKIGKLSQEAMFNVFNMGIGMVIALPAKEAEKAIEILAANGQKAQVIGKVEEQEAGKTACVDFV